ncbi:hypothetical protein [Hymenobacter glacieicola]|uniref:hypothetical protein n=1 Tax=Hymenobacter glacieicola TaxID=1562124 RepID=UPI001E3C016E|nr:hypothetical protein [Hymenobacter glacieicola]
MAKNKPGSSKKWKKIRRSTTGWLTFLAGSSGLLVTVVKNSNELWQLFEWALK